MNTESVSSFSLIRNIFRMSVKNESQNETPFNLGGHVIKVVLELELKQTRLQDLVYKTSVAV